MPAPKTPSAPPEPPKRGRPKKPDAKVLVTLRLSPDVLAAMRKSGPGWQTHANDVLRLHYLSGAAEGHAAPEVTRRPVKPALHVVTTEGRPVAPPQSRPKRR